MMKDLDQLVSELADQAEPLKPAPPPYLLSLMWIGAAILYLAVSLMLSGFRPDLGQALARPWFAVEIAALVLIFIATSFSASLLGFPDLYQKRSLAFTPLGAFALFLTAMVLAGRADSPPAPLPEHSFECTISIGLMTLLPAAWTFYSIRRFASTHARWAGSVAVLSAFSVGALWLRLHEVNDSIMHVIEWHYLPMLAAGLIGLALGRRLFRW